MPIVGQFQGSALKIPLYNDIARTCTLSMMVRDGHRSWADSECLSNKILGQPFALTKVK